MNIKIDFDNIKVKETRNDFTVKVLMLKGEKGEQGDLNHNDIIDNLTSTDNTKVLSAKQGKVLKDLVDTNIAEITVKPYYFNTVADMKDYDLKVGDFAITKGYYSENDGGGALYNIVSTSSGYYETLDNNLLAELIVEEQITPEMFGAKGDGITDDTTSFQNMFAFGVPIKCKSSAIYGIKNCDMGNVDIILDGNNCTFLNIQLNMSATSEDIYKTSMFYSGYSNLNGGAHEPNIIIKNATFDGNKDNLTNIRKYWDAIFSLIHSNNVIFDNVHFKDTIVTANILSGVLNYTIKNSSLNEISTRQESILSGASRNGYEIFNTSYRANKGQFTHFIAENIKVSNVNDSFGRFDTSEYVSITNSSFNSVSNTYEQDISSSTTLTAPNKLIIFENNILNECGTMMMVGSSNDSLSFNTKVNITNCSSYDNSIDTSVGGFINIVGIGTIAHINNVYLQPLSSSNINGSIYAGKKAKLNLNNCYIDTTSYSNKPIFYVPKNGSATINITNSTIKTTGATDDRLVNANNSSTSGVILKIYNSEIISRINAEFYQLEVYNSYIESNTFFNLGNTPTNLLALRNNRFKTTATSGYIFSTNQIPTDIVIDNNIFESDTNHSYYLSLKPSTNIFTFSNNIFVNIGNLQGAWTIQTGSISKIHDNRCSSISMTGTATIEHNNVGITITP